MQPYPAAAPPGKIGKAGNPANAPPWALPPGGNVADDSDGPRNPDGAIKGPGCYFENLKS